MFRLALTCVLSFCFSCLAFSDTIHVPADQPTIQDGIDAAFAGDTVMVAPGTYIENIDFMGKAITVISSDGPEATHIDGGQPENTLFGSVVTFSQGEGNDSVLEGFTLFNGAGTYLSFSTGDKGFCGGGILCKESSPSIINNTITQNTVDYLGGGIALHKDALPLITQNRISQNVGSEGGGGISCYLRSNAQIIDNLISNNFTSTDGGGIKCREYASPLILDNRISKNSAPQGGGISCYLHSSPEIIDNTIKDHNVSASGGGIYVNMDSNPLIDGCVIKNNSATNDKGGGIRIRLGSKSTVRNCTITLNYATLAGGGISITSHCEVELTNNTITDNSSGTYGGGIDQSGTCVTEIRGNTIARNTAQLGGGIRSGQSCSVMIFANKFLENEGVHGGAIYMKQNVNPEVIDNLFEGNAALTKGGGIHIEKSSITKPQIYGNRFIANLSQTGGGVSLLKSKVDFYNNLLYANKANTGGAIHSFFSSIMMVNNTIVNNKGLVECGGLYHTTGSMTFLSNLTIGNTILWGNTSPAFEQLWVDTTHSSFTMEVASSNIEGGQAAAYIGPDCSVTWGADVIDMDPGFVNANGNEDFHLRYTSPCRDTGTLLSAWIQALPDEDIDGNPRQVGSMIDMGADEFSPHFYCTGDFQPLGDIKAKLIGFPGTGPLYIMLGSKALEIPYPTKWGDFYLDVPWMFIGSLGTIPQEGVMTLFDTILEYPPAPYDVYLQALIGLDSDSLSDLFVLEVR